MPTKNKTATTKETWTTKSRTLSGLNNKNNTNVVVKKRKEPLKPTKASAAAIASQANRAKKQALLEKFATEDIESIKDKRSTKIPLWVRIFFGCSLLLFCVSFYKAVIYPRLDIEVVSRKENKQVVQQDDKQEKESNNITIGSDVTFNLNNEYSVDNNDSYLVADETSQEKIIKSFFETLSNKDFDGMMLTMDGSVKKSSAIQEHFTEFRMVPFLWWIDWNKLVPENIRYVSTSDSWKETYGFDISYVISSTQDRYDETWEVVVDKVGGEWKIVRINCMTSWCSKHPIFWPEKVGLM